MKLIAMDRRNDHRLDRCQGCSIPDNSNEWLWLWISLTSVPGEMPQQVMIQSYLQMFLKEHDLVRNSTGDKAICMQSDQ